MGTTTILELSIRWAVPFVLGGMAAALVANLRALKKVRDGMQSMLRAEIIRDYKEYTAKGWCPIYAREALERAYKAYHALGGNDVATELYKKTLELPTSEEGAVKNDEHERD